NTLLSTIYGIFYVPSFPYVVWFINFATEPFPEYSHASQRRHFRSAPKNFANSGFEPPQDHFHHVRAPAGAVIGGDEVVADPQRVEHQAAGLDLILVAAEGVKANIGMKTLTGISRERYLLPV